eukprot:1644509-Rhodomonas_salina.1
MELRREEERGGGGGGGQRRSDVVGSSGGKVHGREGRDGRSLSSRTAVLSMPILLILLLTAPHTSASSARHALADNTTLSSGERKAGIDFGAVKAELCDPWPSCVTQWFTAEEEKLRSEPKADDVLRTTMAQFAEQNCSRTATCAEGQREKELAEQIKGTLRAVTQHMPLHNAMLTAELPRAVRCPLSTRSQSMRCPALRPRVCFFCFFFFLCQRSTRA